MQAYEGFIEDGRFTPIGNPVKIRGRRRVVLTILDEPVQMSRMERELRASWLKKLNAAIESSSDEELPDIPRSDMMNEPLDLDE